MQCYKILNNFHFCAFLYNFQKKNNPIQEKNDMLFLWLNIKMDSIWTKHNVRFKV